MRKIYLTLCLLLAVALPAVAQNFNVTFQVDMQNVSIVDDTVSVAGDFQDETGVPADWTPGATILTDGNSDNVYDVTVSIPAGTYGYKFLNGAAWGTDEGVPGACNVSGNRSVTISSDMTIPIVCFGSCAACPSSVDTVQVTFEVEMRYLTISDTVSVAGDFQSDAVGMGWSDWTPGATVLTDGNNDSIYTVTMNLPEGSYQYKYVNGTAWGHEESVPAACNVGGNRTFTVTGPGPVTIPVHCFASCTSCVAPLPPINVTFRVDMSNEIPDDSIFVAGTFQNPAWVKNVLEMTDPDLNSIYEFTESMIPNEYQYKFYNGPSGDAVGENYNFLANGCGVDNGIGGYNRLLDLTGRLSDTILPVYVFNSCATTAVGVDPQEDGTVFAVYPNPFHTSTIVELQRYDRKSFDIRMVSVTGQVVMERKGIRSSQVELTREGINAGLYFIELRDSQGRQTTRKVVIE